MQAINLQDLGKFKALEINVFQKAVEQLGAGNFARLDYIEIARELGTSRESVSNNVNRLVADGLLISHGKKGFSVCEGILIETA